MKIMRDYFAALGAMGTKVHECPNCLQRGVEPTTAQRNDPAVFCKLCLGNSQLRHPENGLDLRLDGAEARHKSLKALGDEWGDLSVTEEMLISRVHDCVVNVILLPREANTPTRAAASNSSRAWPPSPHSHLSSSFALRYAYS